MATTDMRTDGDEINTNELDDVILGGGVPFDPETAEPEPETPPVEEPTTEEPSQVAVEPEATVETAEPEVTPEATVVSDEGHTLTKEEYAQLQTKLAQYEAQTTEAQAKIKALEEVRDQKTTEQQEAELAQSILDAYNQIDVSDDDIGSLLSGDTARATEVLRRFAATIGAIVLDQARTNIKVPTNNDIFQAVDSEYQKQAKWNQYQADTRKAFESAYPDLTQYGDITQSIAQEVARENPNKWPHEYIDEVGKKAMARVKQLTGGNQPNGRTGVGEPTTTLSPAAEVSNKPLTDDEKERLDVLDTSDLTQ